MLQRSEKKILNLIKMIPLYVSVISIIVIYIIINEHKHHTKDQIKKAQEEQILDKKLMVKREVLSVHSLIQTELDRTETKIKYDIKNRVNEAISIAISIYENNKDKDEKLVKKLIFDALRAIRFNDSRGYFFIYDHTGKNVMHPILKDIVGKSLWDFQDKKGLYVIRELTKISKEKGEGFLTWWWNKPNGIEDSYEKIGFVKTFKPYNWYIGTGEYVVDYEARLQKELLANIQNIRYGKDGYIFVIDKDGTYLSHIKKDYVGLNRINLEDKNGVLITKSILQAAKLGEGYVSYVGTIKPTTGKAAEKISYIKGFEHWNWAIGSGVYIDEINSNIDKESSLIRKNNESQFNKIIMISLSIFVILFILSFYLASITKNKFLEYNKRSKAKNKKLSELNNTLEQKVEDRTKELKEAIENLKLTQNKLIEAEKMSSLGVLVAGVAHEINTPVGIGITGSTHLLEITNKLEEDYKNENMSQNDFEKYLASAKEVSILINTNLHRTSQLVKNFKQISFDQSSEEQRKINLALYIDEILFSMGNIVKKTNISIQNNCDENINIVTYPGVISQVITNLIINSIKHGFENDNSGNITIEATIEDQIVKLVYKDNGKGIDKDILPKIFDPFFTTNRDDGGTGLGLNIIYNLITNSLHGTISCNSKKGEGVEFTILFQKNETKEKLNKEILWLK